VVDQAINQRGRHLGIAEDARPLAARRRRRSAPARRVEAGDGALDRGSKILWIGDRPFAVHVETLRQVGIVDVAVGDRRSTWEVSMPRACRLATACRYMCSW